MNRFVAGMVLLWAVALSAFSQSKAVDIMGRIMEGDTNQPAIAASVQLLSLPDSTQSTGMACSTEGYYRLQAKPGKYVLKVSYLGYITQLVPLQIASQTKRMPDVVLQPDAILLAEAVVTAHAPQVKAVDDTIHLNSSAYRTQHRAVLGQLLEIMHGAATEYCGTGETHGYVIAKVLLHATDLVGY